MATWRCLRADQGAILREGLRVSCENRQDHILCRKWRFSGFYRCLRSPRLRFSARREAVRFLGRLGRKDERDVAACGWSGECESTLNEVRAENDSE